MALCPGFCPCPCHVPRWGGHSTLGLPVDSGAEQKEKQGQQRGQEKAGGTWIPERLLSFLLLSFGFQRLPPCPCAPPFDALWGHKPQGHCEQLIEWLSDCPWPAAPRCRSQNTDPLLSQHKKAERDTFWVSVRTWHTTIVYGLFVPLFRLHNHG